jgi:hypothetical protein
MQFKLDHAPLSLTDGALLNISDAAGRSLRVLDGRVWITQQGSLDDVFLDAGDSLTFTGSGSAIVTAEGRRGAKATVLFDVPLTVQARTRVKSPWMGVFGAASKPTAQA